MSGVGPYLSAGAHVREGEEGFDELWGIYTAFSWNREGSVAISRA